MLRTTTVAAFLLPLALTTAAYAGPDWLEHGDAGSVLNTSQIVVGIGQLESISGSLNSGIFGGDLEDMYLVRITEPTTFSFSLNGTLNSVVWLFNVTQADEAFGLLANDNGPKGIHPLLDGPATDGTMVSVNNPGIYAIAISASGRVPTSIGGPIFDIEIPTEISGPDGPGGLLPHTGWTGQGGGGNYSIEVTGVNYVDVPAPGAAVTLVIGVACATCRRRR